MYLCAMGILQDPDAYFMAEAIKLAGQALVEDEVPVGAVAVSGGKVIARAYNMVERLHDPTAHAEMQAITAACNYLGSKYLHNCTLYVSLEPCTMCATALFWAQIGRLVYGAADEKLGFSRYAGILHPATEIRAGIRADESAVLLRNFFRGKR